MKRFLTLITAFVLLYPLANAKPPDDMSYLTKTTVLSHLPKYADKWETVIKKQEVSHIINNILQSHREFAPYYDQIGRLFEGATLDETCDNLFYFCRDNIRYKEETEDMQSTALPTGILVRGYGDCKHYASFIAGCLDALRRAGERIDWCYAFVSYKMLQPTPYHVFVIVNKKNGEEIWIDPTPGAEVKEPVWIQKCKP